MSQFPRAIKLVQLSTGAVAKLVLSRPKAYYSRAQSARLVAPALRLDPVTGLAMIDITFPTPLKDSNYVPVGFSVMNYADALIDIVKIDVQAIVTLPGQNGFTLLLSVLPPTDNYYLNWSLAEVTNP